MYYCALFLAESEKTASKQLFTLQVYRIILIGKLREPFPAPVLFKTGAWLKIHFRNTLEAVEKLFP
jgi:hypothetical protein